MSARNITQWAEEQTTALREQRLNDIAQNIRTSLESVALSIVNIGNELLEAKELLPHGEFLPWVREKFDWDVQELYIYFLAAIKVKNRLADKWTDAREALHRQYHNIQFANIRNEAEIQALANEMYADYIYMGG